MIREILRALNDWLDAKNAHDDELLSVARQFAIELHLAKCLHGHKPEIMVIVKTISWDFLHASERHDLNGMRDSLAAMCEWTR
jgi:hypothetical protein